MRLADLAGKRVAVWGYGREGRVALSTLRKRFPDKPLSLICSATEAQGAHALGDPELSIIADEAEVATLAQFDIVIKSPGISVYKSPLPEAARAGVRFTSGSALWFAENPRARTICVTGTKGKSTVTALIAHILRKSGKSVALAGNIGLPLLELLDPLREPDWWAIELSSFQTRDFAGAPTVAVINNLYEEHLDWHVTRENYVADKLAIATRAQRLVVAAQPELLARTAAHPQRSEFGGDAAWHVRGDAIQRGHEKVLALADVPLPGPHNAHNVCAALAAIEAASEECGLGGPLLDSGDQGRAQKIDARAMAAHVASFRALPHRLQTLGRRDGIDYINDSISTTPYAAIEALRSLPGRAVAVLVGGFDRGVDWKVFVDYVAKYPPRGIVTMGANGANIAAALREIANPGFALESVAALDAALACARALAPAGGAILLSPGAPSFDQFRDYAERGRDFARLAGFDPVAIAQIEGLGIA
jgi:UDP-N-acetylmuramoylalanine--D-glutamate ligase